MLIKAKVTKIDRVKVDCPDDGIHVVGKSGKIKGVHAVWFVEDVETEIGTIGKRFMVWKGSVGFFYPTSEKKGIKVFYSFTRGDTQKRKAVTKEYKQLQKLWKLDLAPKPYSMGTVNIRLDIEGKIVRRNCFMIEVQRLYPPEAMKGYAMGFPYKWDTFKHKDHAPKGFLKFQKKVRKVHKIGSAKLGDLLFCTKKKRWYIVDTGG